MWTDKEINILKENYGKMSIQDIPLNRSLNSIRHKASRLNLYKDQSLRTRFFDKVLKTDSCWIWTGGGGRYGYIKSDNINENNIMAHRASWKIHFSDIPKNMFVLHKCDNTRCVNPDHLFLGTQLDNMIDMKLKGRANGGSLPGEKSGASKLTNEQVFEIRKLGLSELSHQKIADRFNVSRCTISFIIKRKTWKHI